MRTGTGRQESRAGHGMPATAPQGAAGHPRRRGSRLPPPGIEGASCSVGQRLVAAGALWGNFAGNPSDAQPEVVNRKRLTSTVRLPPPPPLSNPVTPTNIRRLQLTGLGCELSSRHGEELVEIETSRPASDRSRITHARPNYDVPLNRSPIPFISSVIGPSITKTRSTNFQEPSIFRN